MIQLARLKSEDVTNVSLEVGQPLVDLKETASEDNKKYAALYVGKGNTEGERSTEKVKFYDSKYVDENLVNTIKIASDKTISPIEGQMELAAGDNITLSLSENTGNKIVITSKDTRVTSAANHYSPSTTSGYQLSDTASSSISATWGSTSLVTGVELSRDSKGHVTGLSVTSSRMPSNPNTAHTHTVGVGLDKEGNGGTSGNVKYKVKLYSEDLDTFAISQRYSPNSARMYPVIPDAEGQLAVIVPWTDNTYTAGKNLTVASNAFSLKDDITLSSITVTSITSTGTIEAVKFNATSDKRLKTNITEFKPKRSILDLKVKKFDFIGGPKNQIGCLAQDLQAICPEIVNERADGYLSIQESKLIYLLLEEVKQLRFELDSLTANLDGGGLNH